MAVWWDTTQPSPCPPRGMGACASLCRAADAPRRGEAKARSRREAPPAQQPEGQRAEVEAAAPPVPAGIHLGFASGFAERYELGGELGHGQFAVVRRATDRATGEPVAVKLVPKRLLNDAQDNADHIRREARARGASRLRRRARKAQAEARPRNPRQTPVRSPGQHLEGAQGTAARGAPARGVRGRRGGAARARVRPSPLQAALVCLPLFCF